ncbi:BTB/POZ domain-containing protein 19-like isoform X4 [Chiloscyllium plagiosum]|uniref:BTB/POZ domain-containing protein 19-like isoform X4 n=1 Tax=Chiloscyllium plagiosum TaxID=36176 RepID=UPI001CB832C4|nr:BTB/POZ domain-containing protein 19-like isoform X4 [Chiloscyllium plagiosum]
MRKMINAPEMSDVKFIVGEEQKVVYAHRCILAYRCEAFRTMFAQRVLSHDAKEAEVPFVLSDVQPDVFLAVVEFLYTNCVMLSRDIALDVLTSAVEYGLDELQRMCVDYINSTLTVESACEALQAAVTYRQTNMKDKCLAFIEGHTKVVLDKPVPEIAKDVICELRLFLLSPEELTILEAENKKDNLIPMDKIAEVWKFHALKKPSGITAHLPRRRKGTRLREHHKYLNLYHK